MEKEEQAAGIAVGGILLFTFLWLKRAEKPPPPPPKWEAELGTPTFSEV